MADATAAPPCCPPGSLGPAKVHPSRTPQGTLTTIPAPSSLLGIECMPCYCTGSPLATATQIIVLFTDVYGMESGHHKVFADCLAERLNDGQQQQQQQTTNHHQVSVVIPDLFRGQPIMRPWLENTSFLKDMVGSLFGAPGMVFRIKNYPPQKVEQEIFQMILPWLQEEAPKATSLGGVGFCFGGWVVGRVLGFESTAEKDAATTTTTTTDDSSNHDEATIAPRLSFQCGVGIHPSFDPNILHGEAPATMAARIFKPMLLLPGWNDISMKPGSNVVNIMTQNRMQQMQKSADSAASTADNETKQEDTDKQKEETVIVSVEFPSMGHGWVTRGDPSDPKVAAEQEKALEMTVEFIQKHAA